MMNKKALFGLLGVGTLTAAWFLLPKDSKIKKAITDGVCQLTDGLRARATTVAKNVTPEAVKSR
jgi:hypothetical protein